MNKEEKIDFFLSACHPSVCCFSDGGTRPDPESTEAGSAARTSPLQPESHKLVRNLGCRDTGAAAGQTSWLPAHIFPSNPNQIPDSPYQVDRFTRCLEPERESFRMNAPRLQNTQSPKQDFIVLLWTFWALKPNEEKLPVNP